MGAWVAAYLAEPATLITLAVLVTLAVALHRPLARRAGWSPWPTGAALLTLAVIGALTLLPAPGPTLTDPTWSALPGCARELANPVAAWRGLIDQYRVERISNTLMFMPLTFFGVLATRRPRPVALAGMLLPVAIETAQVVLVGSRSCTAVDWLTNALGAALGALTGWLVLRRTGRRD